MISSRWPRQDKPNGIFGDFLFHIALPGHALSYWLRIAKLSSKLLKKKNKVGHGSEAGGTEDVEAGGL